MQSIAAGCVIFLLLLKEAERYRGAIRVKLFACFFLQIKSDFACSGIYKGKKKGFCRVLNVSKDKT